LQFLLYFHHFFHFIPSPYSYVAWVSYWIVQGLVFSAIFVIAHERGHNAFCDYQWVNDTVGFILHSALLVPYFSWKNGHRRHHSNTSSLERVMYIFFVPRLKSELKWYYKYLNNPLGQVVTLAFTIILGEPLHLAFNLFGKPSDLFACHFDPYAPICNDREIKQIYISNAGVIAATYVLYRLALAQGLPWLICFYGVPLLIAKNLYILVTFLHHTHPSLLGEYYQFDDTPVHKAIWRDFKKCIYVEKDEESPDKGVFWYKNKF
ncbi:delta(12)-fatty-acid desaturase FAD2-like, partial [Nicotiana sylvestris]|uniref:delta(12)-fatty-acid desaturase FAD2-like n=1 Tax=Nicotiana sylvestris TaxID=4096 RepID=UPI00388C9980